MRTTITGNSNISVSRLEKTRNNNRRTNECINEIAERLEKNAGTVSILTAEGVMKMVQKIN